MKKTTIYLEDDEYKTLKTKAFVEDVSVAELLRRGARLVCKNVTPEEEKAMQALDRIRKAVAGSGASEAELNKEILEEQRAVRKKRSRG